MGKILQTIFVGVIFLLFLLGILPYLFIAANNYLNLPIYNQATLDLFGLIFIFIGGTVNLYCYYSFFFIGKGTPVPTDPPKKLISNGFYKFTRNPIYIGWGFIIFGGTLILGHLFLFLYPIMLMIYFHFFVILYEEPTLKKRFGRDYQRYLDTVPRWLPKIEKL